jgi:hypothetical protein
LRADAQDLHDRVRQRAGIALDLGKVLGELLLDLKPPKGSMVFEECECIVHEFVQAEPARGTVCRPSVSGETVRELLHAIKVVAHDLKRPEDIPAPTLALEHEELEVVRDHAKDVVNFMDEAWSQLPHGTPVRLPEDGRLRRIVPAVP